MTGPQGMGPAIPGGGTPGFPGGGAPLTVTINQKSGQPDPTQIVPVQFTVIFSEPVTGFTAADVVITGTAGASTCAVSGSGAVYTVTVPPAPSVTIDQAVGQADPTTGDVQFQVHFSEAVTGFGSSGVIITGTSNPSVVTVSGSGADYTVTVSGMTTPGTIIANIPAGAVANVGGIRNVASSSTDNTVSFSLPTVLATGGTISYAGGRVYHTFTGNGTFTPSTSLNCEIFGIGGGSGGSGGTSSVNYGAGGAAGARRIVSATISTPQTVTIGAGGATNGGPGSATTVGSLLTAPGGLTTGSGRQGGSNADFAGGVSPSDNYSSGGGAGAGANGNVNGIGGAGVQYPSGSGVYYGGGGGGISGTTPQIGGVGGGASGTTSGGNNAPANKGAGGGGGSSGAGGAGGSGIVIISY